MYNKKRNEAYTKLNEMFSFLIDDKLTTSDVKIASNLVKIYPFHLEKDFVEEFLVFVNFIKTNRKQINNEFSKRQYCFSNLFRKIWNFLRRGTVLFNVKKD